MTDLAHAAPDQRQIWESWHHTHSYASPSGHAEAELETFVKSLPAGGPGLRILEVGCGQGRDAINLARRDYEVTAFDLSPTAIRIARANALSADVKVDFGIRDASQQLPYGNDAFHGIFAHLALHYFDDFTTHSVFMELARVLKPGGILYFTVRSVKDHFYRKGKQIDANLYCYEGHVRGFFDISCAQELLRNWDIRACEYYEVVAERRDNPGKFLRVIALLPLIDLPRWAASQG
jgi:SAM-dependent methyltransferase